MRIVINVTPRAGREAAARALEYGRPHGVLGQRVLCPGGKEVHCECCLI
jgi:hypothetical protein